MTEHPNGGQLSELALIVARLSETVARQQQEISGLREAIRIMADQADPEEAPPKFDLAGRPL